MRRFPVTEYKQIQRRKTSADEDAVDAEPVMPLETTADIDSILDEIDGVLEENAEEFVRGYVQHGGQLWLRISVCHGGYSRS
jgi:ubiquitin-like protein Pup